MEKISLVDLGAQNMREYGAHVILQRAIPDYRDALKPVHRRILWSMGPTNGNLNLKPNGPRKKVARVVGDTMGKYHPHGESSIFEALVKMAKSNQFTNNLIDGDGNFGNYNEKPAAQRYIECRMSKLGWNGLLDPAFLKITPLVSSYDGQEKEPVFLPCLVPLILLNGTYGIAVGSMSSIPPIHPETVQKMTEEWFKKGKVTEEFICRHLKFKWHYGSNCVSTEEELKAWVKSGDGAIYFEPTYTVDKMKRTITFTDVPPFFKWDSVVKALSGEEEKKKGKKPRYDYVSDYGDYRDKKSKAAGLVAKIVIKLKNTVPPEDFNDKVKDLVKLMTNHYTTNTNVTERITDEDVEFDKYNIAGLFHKWMRYRVDLEVQMHNQRIKEVNEDIYLNKLFQLAALNRKIIFQSLEQDKPIEWLAEKLEIEVKDSDTILRKATISLARINESTLKDELVKLRTKKSDIIKIRDNPNSTVQGNMGHMLQSLV